MEFSRFNVRVYIIKFNSEGNIIRCQDFSQKYETDYDLYLQ